MTGNKKICPDCGTAHTDSANVCRNCGYEFPKQPGISQENLKQVVDTVQKVSSTVSKVQSTVGQVDSIAKTVGTITRFTVTPPAKWEVIIGGALPELGNEAVDKVVTTAASQAQVKVQEHVVQEITSRIGDNIIKTHQESFTPIDTPPVTPQSYVCQSCGFFSPPGNKFCGSCGVILGGHPDLGIVPPSLACPACGKKMNPGAKFCGNCGATPGASLAPRSDPSSSACLVCGKKMKPEAKFCGNCGATPGAQAESPPHNHCPSCGSPLKQGVTFCGKCGGRI